MWLLKSLTNFSNSNAITILVNVYSNIQLTSLLELNPQCETASGSSLLCKFLRELMILIKYWSTFSVILKYASSFNSTVTHSKVLTIYNFPHSVTFKNIKTNTNFCIKKCSLVQRIGFILSHSEAFKQMCSLALKSIAWKKFYFWIQSHSKIKCTQSIAFKCFGPNCSAKLTYSRIHENNSWMRNNPSRNHDTLPTVTIA